MATLNSQKKSPRSSAKSKQDTGGRPDASFDDLDEEMYLDRSNDQVARVRAAKDAAQREMESFGDVSEYDVTILQGQLKVEAVAVSQSKLEFQVDKNIRSKGEA
ncbi:MAG: hypothetical protein M3Y50_15710 [Acidobacteriota bacterium]|nr:hypothetical protein [Acidobacteriota bacterium]